MLLLPSSWLVYNPPVRSRQRGLSRDAQQFHRVYRVHRVTRMQGGYGVKTFLIVGVETVVGANLAAAWSARHRVLGVASDPRVSVPGGNLIEIDSSSAETVRQGLQLSGATHVVLCGAAARSTWEGKTITGMPANPETWAMATANAGIHFTLISSDAIFTGPWMFHDEDCESICSSDEAVAFRESEQRVLSANPQALVVRTRAFGWSPLGSEGWLESLLSSLENHRPIELDPFCHATPIHASDLADYLEAALLDELSGVYHIAGAERVNPHQFVNRLAALFGLDAPQSHSIRVLTARPTGFARGETSLQTSRFRREYDCTMPMLNEGLARLLEQHESGYREQLCTLSISHGKAA
jgi:dTDP-4-dehydrorhamnose reductase